MACGNAEEAFVLLKKSADIAPTVSHAKWMYLGQMQAGFVALSCFQKGIHLLLQEKQQLEQSEGKGVLQSQEGIARLRDLKREISAAYCSIAELYTRDLCDEGDAEAQCERHFQLAVDECNWSPEAAFGFANLRFIQGRIDESKAMLSGALQLLANIFDITDPTIPPYDMRVNMGKLAMEMEQWESAMPVFEKLLDEDDRYIEVWYLLGVCFLRSGAFLGAKECLEKAKESFERMEKNGQLEPNDRPLIVTVNDLYREAEELLASAPLEPDAMEEDENGDDQTAGVMSATSSGGSRQPHYTPWADLKSSDDDESMEG
jgi:tetratricopeptide (TPR) repeat protein